MSEVKLEPLQRLELESELAIRTNYHEYYIKNLSDKKLIELLKVHK